MDLVRTRRRTYRLVSVPKAGGGLTLAELAESHGLVYSSGAGYYQLAGRKKQSISSTKHLVWWDGDEALDDPAEIRKKLGLPVGRTVKISESDVSDGALFVQSTSANRRLTMGSSALFISDDVGDKKEVGARSSLLPSPALGSRRAAKRKADNLALSAEKHESVNSDSTEDNTEGHRAALDSATAVPASESVIRPTCHGRDFGLKWEECGDMFFCLDGHDLPGSDSIIGFDLDHTLVAPKSGRKFPTGRRDWKWLFSCVPGRLRGLYNAGYKIVIFTNQGGIEKKRTSPLEIQGKILDISKELGFPLQAFIAGGMNQYRKPHARMWEELIANYNQGVSASKSKCLYIGDAAGRPHNWAPGRKKDFSSSDRMFAYNADVAFATPEEFFLGHAKAKFFWGGFDPKAYIAKKKANNCTPVPSAATKQEIVVLVGPPASGKSHMAKTALRKYTWINRDTLKTAAKCIKEAKRALGEGKSVVVDNTSPSIKARAPYIDMAKAAGIRARCWELRIDRPLCHHLNFIREGVTEGKRRRVPNIAFNCFYKNYESPSKDEGFDEVSHIDFSIDLSIPKVRNFFMERSA